MNKKTIFAVIVSMSVLLLGCTNAPNKTNPMPGVWEMSATIDTNSYKGVMNFKATTLNYKEYKNDSLRFDCDADYIYSDGKFELTVTKITTNTEGQPTNLGDKEVFLVDVKNNKFRNNKAEDLPENYFHKK